jgi:hypothetical protein
MKMKRTQLSLLKFTVFILLLTSCSKKTDTTPPVVPASSAKVLTAFSFLKSNNTSLDSDRIATIAGDSAIIVLPANITQRNLIATYTVSDKATLNIGTTVQSNSVTVNDFTNIVTYTVKAEDGSTANYKVKINGKAVLPILTTTTVSVFTAITGYSGGNISNDGGSAVTARGVCWSTSQNPTIADNKSTDSLGIGTYTSLLHGLVPSTAYYARAYATNAVGTVYGNQVNMTTRADMKYLKPSYELSNYGLWLSGTNFYNNGSPISPADNPLSVMQTCQIDINGDGKEDALTYDSYSLSISPTPNPPPSIFINNGATLNKTAWTGPTIKDPHGVKLLIGDYNNDGYPDLFSVVGVDAPNGAFPNLLDNCHLLFNSATGFNKVKEFDTELGFYYAGCSGDIDNDGDLDIIMFNFHVQTNNVKSKILWNDGAGNFTSDANGIGSIPLVDQAELIDMNNDGYLDLAMIYISSINPRTNNFTVMWGNGKGFSLNRATSFNVDGTKFFQDIDFADINNDGIKEIIASGSTSTGTNFINIYGSDDKGVSYIDKTSQLVDNNTCARFARMRVQDIDGNGKLDIFSNDKLDNVRWEWNGTKFIKQ